MSMMTLVVAVVMTPLGVAVVEGMGFALSHGKSRIEQVKDLSGKDARAFSSSRSARR